MRGHEEYKEMLTAHALGALEAAEARELDAHVETCAQCRAEFDEWRDTAASLAFAAPTSSPSAAVRSRILDSVRSVKIQDRPTLDSDSARAVASGAGQTFQFEAKVMPFEKPARRDRNRAWKIGALAASVAFVALVISLILLWSRYSAVQQEVARLSDRLSQTEEELVREREVIKFVTAPEASISTLAGTEAAKTAHAKFVLDRKTGRAMLMAYNLPTAPAGKAYQLWYIEEGKPAMPGHVFTPDARGYVEMKDQLPSEARSAKVFAVTLEPSTGAQTPTAPIYLMSARS